MDCVERLVDKIGQLNATCGNFFLPTSFVDKLFHFTTKMEKKQCRGNQFERAQ